MACLPTPSYHGGMYQILISKYGPADPVTGIRTAGEKVAGSTKENFPAEDDAAAARKGHERAHREGPNFLVTVRATRNRKLVTIYRGSAGSA